MKNFVSNILKFWNKLPNDDKLALGLLAAAILCLCPTIPLLIIPFGLVGGYIYKSNK